MNLEKLNEEQLNSKSVAELVDMRSFLMNEFWACYYDPLTEAINRKVHGGRE